MAELITPPPAKNYDKKAGIINDLLETALFDKPVMQEWLLACIILRLSKALTLRCKSMSRIPPGQPMHWPDPRPSVS